jgi:hypothetical protein
MPPPAVIHWGVAVGDQAAAAVGVVMPERAVDHVSDGLEAAVRMPGRSLRLARRVVHLAHLVHVDERVELPQVDAGECAAHREALALVGRRRCRHRQDRPVLTDSRIRPGDPGQQQNILDGDRWHDSSSSEGGARTWPAAVAPFHATHRQQRWLNSQHSRPAGPGMVPARY